MEVKKIRALFDQVMEDESMKAIPRVGDTVWAPAGLDGVKRGQVQQVVIGISDVQGADPEIQVLGIRALTPDLENPDGILEPPVSLDQQEAVEESRRWLREVQDRVEKALVELPTVDPLTDEGNVVKVDFGEKGDE